jgi:hypothetical protein
MRYRAEVHRGAQALADLRRENELLLEKLERTSRALRGLASDLAASRRELRLKDAEIAQLRARLERDGG